jgi:hypothetical protein
MLVAVFALGAFSAAHVREACARENRTLGVGDVVTVTISGDQAELAKGDAEAQDAAVLRVAVQITSVRPDGSLVLAAEREIRSDGFTQHSSLSGIVRPEEVDLVTRTVDSNQVADFRLENRTVKLNNRKPVDQAAHLTRSTTEQRLKQYEVRIRFAEEGAAVDGKKALAKMLAAPTVAVVEKRDVNFVIGGEAQVGLKKVPFGTSLKLNATSIDDNRVRLAGVLEVSTIGSPEDDLAVRESTAVHFDKTVTCGETIRLCMSKSENCSRYFELTAEETRVDSQTEPVGAAATSAEDRLLPYQR